MRQRQAYTGIDIFRWAAAFLIVAIHTSPLASYSETGDFILTRVIARVAVPFFLMTSGFFLLGGSRRETGRLSAGGRGRKNCGGFCKRRRSSTGRRSFCICR